MGREENALIFEDTKKLCETNKKLIEAIKLSSSNQKLILENENIELIKPKFDIEAKLIVSKKRSFEAASAYENQKVCVLNFASSTNPGGGVVNGSSAQEEALCRCSTLYFNLDTKYMWDNFYNLHRSQKNPLNNDDCIYTPNVKVFKADNASPKLLPEKDWYDVNIITCAAPNLRPKPSNPMNPYSKMEKVIISNNDLLLLHEKRLRKILSIAAKYENEIIILGAFGCGAFLNSPHIVSKAAQNVIKDFRNYFKVIEFAVYCSQKDETNYRIFKQAIR